MMIIAADRYTCAARHYYDSSMDIRVEVRTGIKGDPRMTCFKHLYNNIHTNYEDGNVTGSIAKLYIDMIANSEIVLGIDVTNDPDYFKVQYGVNRPPVLTLKTTGLWLASLTNQCDANRTYIVMKKADIFGTVEDLLFFNLSDIVDLYIKEFRKCQILQYPITLFDEFAIPLVVETFNHDTGKCEFTPIKELGFSAWRSTNYQL